MAEPNQNPEQQARDRIDDRLRQAGWEVQGKTETNITVALGVALKEYSTIL